MRAPRTAKPGPNTGRESSHYNTPAAAGRRGHGHVRLRPGRPGSSLPHRPRRWATRPRAQVIRDIYIAYIWALSQVFPLSGGYNVVMTPRLIRDIHRMMFASTMGEQAGQYKTANNTTEQPDGTLLATMLPHERVQEFINMLSNRINSRFIESYHHGSVSKLLSIAGCVCDILAIHPFSGGNGRPARLSSTYLLERAGYHFARLYSLDAIILERHAEYHAALLAAQRNFYVSREDMTKWIEYYIHCVFVQWLRAYQYVKPGGTPGAAYVFSGPGRHSEVAAGDRRISRPWSGAVDASPGSA